MSKGQEHRKALGEFLGFAWDKSKDLAENIGGGLGTLGANIAIGAGKGAVDIADTLGDATAYGADLLFNTSFGDQEGVLDKAGKVVDEKAKQAGDFVRKKIGPEFMQGQGGELITDVAREAGSFMSPGAIVKGVSLIPKIAKFVPGINAMNEAQKSKFVNEMVQMKKAGTLTKESLQELGNKYSSSVVKSVKEGDISRRADYVLGEAKNLLKDIKPNDIKMFAEKYPKLGRILLSPEKLESWIKENPKKAMTILGTLSSGKVAYDRSDDGTGTSGMLPPSDNVVDNKEEESIDSIEKSIDENSVQYGPTKSSQDTPSYLKGPSLENKDVKGGDTVAPDNKEGTDPQLSKYKEGTIGANVERQMEEGSNLNLKESVADTMRAVGIENGFQGRQRIFEQLFNEPYRGTAEQNIKLREKIKDYSAEDIIDMMKQGYTMTM